LTGTPIFDDFQILDGAALGGASSWIDAITSPFIFGYYRPLVSLSFFADRALFGTNPFFYHQTNLLIHVAGAWAAGWLGWVLTKDKAVATVGGVLFALHPVQAGAVSWIGGRTDSLCALFLALYGAMLVNAIRNSHRRGWWALGAAVCLVMAGFAKEQAMAGIIALPAGLILLSEKRLAWKEIRNLSAPIAAGVIFYLVIWSLMSEREFSAAQRPLIAQAELAGRGMTHNLMLMLSPYQRLMHIYTFEPSRAFGSLPVLLGWLSFAGIGFFVIRLWRSQPVVTWLLVFSSALVLPVSSLIPMPSMHVASYRVLIAVLPLTIAMAVALFRLRKRWPLSAVVGFGLVLAWWVPVTYSHGLDWKSEAAVYRAITESDPNFISLHTFHGGAMAAPPAEAEENLEDLLTWLFDGDDWRSADQTKAAWSDGEAIEARVARNAGIEVNPVEIVSTAFLSLAIVRKNQDDFSGALDAAEAGIVIDPSNGGCYLIAGDALLQQGLDQRAKAFYKQAIARNPSDSASHLALADIYLAEGDLKSAARELEAVTRWNAWMSFGFLELAKVYLQMERPDKAQETLERGIKAGTVTKEQADELMASEKS
jgi:Tfp pilus assembly protein PilF